MLNSLMALTATQLTSTAEPVTRTDMEFVFAVVITGLIVVFVGLVLLIIFVSLLSKAMRGITKPQQSADNTVNQPVNNTKQAVNTQTVVEGDISEEIVAVITAAVSAIMSDENPGSAFTVKSIQKARTNQTRLGRPAWGAAGIQESMQSI